MLVLVVLVALSDIEEALPMGIMRPELPPGSTRETLPQEVPSNASVRTGPEGFTKSFFLDAIVMARGIEDLRRLFLSSPWLGKGTMPLSLRRSRAGWCAMPLSLRCVCARAPCWRRSRAPEAPLARRRGERVSERLLLALKSSCISAASSSCEKLEGAKLLSTKLNLLFAFAAFAAALFDKPLGICFIALVTGPIVAVLDRPLA